MYLCKVVLFVGEISKRRVCEFLSRSIDFVLAFPQADLDVDVFTEPTLGMEVDRNTR